MGTAENKRLVRAIFSGEEKLLDYLTDDVRWTIPGTTLYSGTFNGKGELLDKLLKPLGSQMATVGPFEISNVIAEDDHVVLQAVGTGRTTKTGNAYNNTYCMVFRFAGDKIAEVTEYCDTELVTSAFGSVGDSR